jgi:MFS family permease
MSQIQPKKARAPAADVFVEPPGSHEPGLPKRPRMAARASLVGSVVEYYDFFIYGVAAALVFPDVFFPDSDPKTATVASFATFGVGYVARPIGAVVFGHYGDKIGRKNVLVYTLLLMGASTIGVGLIPSHNQIGIWAPIILVAMRLLQGFSAGGEQAGATTMTLEHAPHGRRAYFTSFTLIGTQLGLIVATSVFIPFSLLPDSVFLSWGWRIPFFLSIIVIVIGLWVRRTMPETPAFEEGAQRGEVPSIPIAELFHRNGLDVVRVAICALIATVSTIVGVYALSFAIDQGGLSRIPMLFVSVAANVVAIGALPLLAKLADRIGRKPLFIAGSLGCIPLIFVYFRAIESGNYLIITLAAIALSGLVYSAVNGIWPSFYAEMFSTRVRYSGMAIGTQIGFGITGFAPTLAASIAGEGPHGWVPVAWMVSGACLLAALCAATCKETSKTHLNDLGKSTRQLQEEGTLNSN